MTDNRRHPISEHTKTIWRLSNEGMPQRKITKLLGLNRGVVSGAVNRGRKSGHCNQKVKTKETVRNLSPLTYGYIGQIIDALSIEQLEWLMVEAEKIGCKTAAEFVAEIVRDTFEEAKSKESGE